jgi:hypothetical protein
MSIRTPFATIALLSFTSIFPAGSVAARPASPFDGVWKREWSNTTPRGVHQVGKRTITIRTSGVSTEMSTLRLTQTISGVTKTLRLVQSCKATKTEIKGDRLTIHWSELKLLSPSWSEIPPGLNVWTEPVTCTYTIRGRDLLAITHNVTDVFNRAAEE